MDLERRAVAGLGPLLRLLSRETTRGATVAVCQKRCSTSTLLRAALVFQRRWMWERSSKSNVKRQVNTQTQRLRTTINAIFINLLSCHTIVMSRSCHITLFSTERIDALEDRVPSRVMSSSRSHMQWQNELCIVPKILMHPEHFLRW